MKRLIQISIVVLGGILFLLGLPSSTNISAIGSYPLYENEVKSIFLGINHSFAITVDEKIFAWGNNEGGQLGNNSTTNLMLPTNITSFIPLLEGETIIQIDGGQLHTLALTSDGRVFAWGDNESGQLGNGTTLNSLIPLNITANFSGINSDPIISLATGFNHSLALTESGKLFVWGSNHYGQLGDGTKVDILTPTLLNDYFSSMENDYLIQIDGGFSHSIALTHLGKVFTWGYNSEGQIGNNTLLSSLTPTNITSNFPFVLPTDGVKSVFAGAQHSMVLTNDGDVFGWGSNNLGQVGASVEEKVLLPIRVSALDELLVENDAVDQIMTGANHTLLLTHMKKVISWGSNNYNQVGNGLVAPQKTPLQINNYFSDFLENEEIESIAVGGNHNLVLSNKTKVRGWGGNQYGQVGLNSLFQQPVPKGLYPKLYKITFDTNEGSEIRPFLAEENETIYPPQAPTKEGNTFVDWYVDMALNVKYQFNQMPASDFTLYAKWLVNKYTISFNSLGGTSVNPINLYFGSLLVEPSAPTKLGHTFMGWYEEANYETPYIFSTMPSRDVTLYAKWNIDQFTISFDSNQGSFVEPLTQDFDSLIAVPSAPSKEGNTFVGWYEDEELVTPYVFGKMPAEDLTLYAKWSINTYTFNFVSNGGSKVLDWSQKFDSLLVFPIVPTKAGYTFSGWFKDIELTNLFTETNMPAENLTLYAGWEPLNYEIIYHLDGGSVINGNPPFFTIEDAPVILNESTKSGYLFAGWFLTPDFNGQPITTLVFNQTKAINVYAKWINERGYKDVIKLIDNLPSIVKIEDKAEITLARNAYNSLSSQEKAEVTNLVVLVAAEEQLSALTIQSYMEYWIIGSLSVLALVLGVLLFFQIRKLR